MNMPQWTISVCVVLLSTWQSDTADSRFCTKYVISDENGEIDATHAAHVQLADFDGDGDMDLVVAKSHEGVVVYENRGENVWHAHALSNPQSIIALAVDVGDFDMDGAVDIVSGIRETNKTNGGHLGWHRNLGNFNFLYKEISAESSDFLRVVDLNQDQIPDILQHSQKSSLNYYRGDGGLWGTAPKLLRYGSVLSMETLDTGDSRSIGLVFGSWRGVTLCAFDSFNNELHSCENLSSGGNSFAFVGDVNEDGVLDIVVGDRTGRLFYLTRDEPTGESWSMVDIGPSPDMNKEWFHKAFPVDVDCDGDLDVVVHRQEGCSISWYENLGGGSFGEMQLVDRLEEGIPFFSIVGDVDGDGFFDIVLYSYYSKRIVWYRNGM